MLDFLPTNFGYAGLFAVSFAAATVLPLGSEAAVALMAATGYNHLAVFLIATAGNVLGSLVNYAVGKWGRRFVRAPWLRIDPRQLARGEAVYGRWGAPILFFAWMPIVGDPLTLAAGVLKVPLPVFIFWVALGKALRYVLVITGASAVVM